jgi:hypothetical protein
MFNIVNARLGGFAVGDRAKMPRDFEPSLVSGLDDRVQFCSRYVYEGLKRGHTLIGPKVHRFAGVFRPSGPRKAPRLLLFEDS